MAPGTKTLGFLVAAAICVALVVAGCGGGSSSSAPATAGSTEAQSTTTSDSSNEGGASGAAKNEPAEAEEKGSGNSSEATGGGKKKKGHPPIEPPEGKPEEGPTKEQEEEVPTAEIAVKIPNGLTSDNTCKGNNASPELTWTGIPPGTEELAIFAVNVQPVNGKLFFDWAIAGVDPSTTGLKEGEVPDGAVLGKTGSGQAGYSLCPKSSGTENYIFSVYAIGKSLSPEEGFDPLDFRVEAGENSEQVGLKNVFYGG